MMFMGRLLCVLSPLVIVVFVIVRAVTLPETPHPRPLVAVPAFRLFPPNAAISLTEDNSTFFPARPAAFGPELPDDGLSAILWIGAGFGEDGVEPQGELGCSDVPGWNGRRAADGVPILPTDKKLDDGTDNYLEDFATGHYYRHPRRSARAKAVPAVDKGAAAAAVHPVQATAAAIDMTTPPLPPPEHSAKLLSPVKAKAAANSNSEGSPGNIQSLQEGAEIAGKIVLLRRGGCGFFAKVMWAQRRGAVAVIVGDDRKGGPLIQMYASGDTSAVLIPSVFTAHTTAHLLTALAESAVLDDQDADTKEKEAHAGGNAEARTKMVVPPTAETGDDGAWFWRKRPREWVLEDYVPPETPAGTDGAPVETRRQLYVTISPSRGGLPLIDTLLVLVASPLLAIVTITCVLLFLRTQCRRRAWRAPKALVEQLPVHIYRPPGAPPPSPLLVPVGSEVASPNPSRPSSPTLTGMHPTVTTPLLQRPRSRTTTGVPGDERRVMVSVPAPPPPQSRYFQSECVVCLEDYVAGDRVMCLPCGHEFHEACITPWLTTRRRTCPICKGDIVRTASGEAA